MHGLFFFVRPETPLSPDEREYIALGIHLAESGELRLPTGEAAKRMPLYPAFIAAVYRWQGAEVWDNTVLMIQTLLAWCTTIIIALTAERLADGRAAWMAGTVAAFYSPFHFLHMSFLTETLLIFLLSLALLLYIAVGIQARSVAGRWVGLIGVSLLIGLGALTRANALLFLVPFAADAAWRAGAARRRAIRAVFVLLPAVAFVFWWGARNSRTIGAFTLSTSGGLNFYLGHNAHYAHDTGLGGETDYQAFDRLRREENLAEVEADQRLYDDGFAFITTNPWQTMLNTFQKTAVWMRTTLPQSGPLTLVLGLGAVVAGGWCRRRRGDLVDSRRSAYVVAMVSLVALFTWWVIVILDAKVPLTTPLYVVPIGLIALLLLRSRPNVRGLLIGLFASQLAVAVVFIPLTRLRWAVDGILIVAIGVGVSRLCRRLWAQPHGQTDSLGRESLLDP